MTVDWQNLVALTVVAVALGYLMRYLWQSFMQKSAGCGSGCGGCSVPAKNGDARLPIVTLQLPAQPSITPRD